MRARFAIAGSLVMMLVLALLLSPASGQTSITPETTPEFWPLTFDPATVTVDPDEFTLVFEAPAGCQISPDWSVVAIGGYGVFDLQTGGRRFALNGEVIAFNPQEPFVFIRGEGVYNYDTGELIIPNTDRNGMFSPDGRWFVDYDTVYDLTTNQPVAELDRAGDGETDYYGAYFEPDGSRLYYVSEINGFVYTAIVDTSTWKLLNDPAPYVDRVQNAVFTGIAVGETLIAVNGDGVYELATGSKRFDIPAFSSMQLSHDEALLVAETSNDITVYDTSSGSIRVQTTVANASSHMLSMVDPKLVVTQYQVVDMPGGGASLEPLSVLVFDVQNGQLIHEFPSGTMVYVLPYTQQISITGSGIYDLDSGELLIELAEDEYVRTSMYGKEIYINSSRATKVVDPETWTVRVTVDGEFSSLSADERWLITDGRSVYDAATGELAFQTDKSDFVVSADGRLLASISRNRCRVYRVPETEQ